MIGLDQIKLLESKVNKAVEQIRVLREENKALKRTVEKSQSRLQELEGLVSRFRSDQEEIEQGILRALKNLDKLEDEVTSRGTRKEAAATAAAATSAATPAAPPAAPSPQPASPAKPARAPEPDRAEPAEGPVVDAAEDDAQAGPPEEQLDIF